VKAEEIADKARSGGLTLAFDTNALFRDKRLFAVCNGVSRYNERLKERGLSPVRLVVCTVAHAEKLFDLKQAFKETFDRDVILQGIQRKGLIIQAFEIRHAMETGVRLGERHATPDAWHAAKKKRCLQCLGLPSETPLEATGQGCGATVDWLIGGHARAEGFVLVTDDTGPEFKGLTERLKLSTLEEALEQLLGEPS
jgi:hypothetical protein